jgi:hypothetical protein
MAKANDWTASSKGCGLFVFAICLNGKTIESKVEASGKARIKEESM